MIKQYSIVSLVIALVALLVAVVQIVLTSPILIEFYRKPELTVSVQTSEAKGPRESTGTLIVVSNVGNAAAEDVEILIWTYKVDQIEVPEGLSFTISDRPWRAPDGPFKVVAVVAEYLLKGERCQVFVRHGSQSERQSTGLGPAEIFPYITVRSRDGIAHANVSDQIWQVNTTHGE